MLFLFKFLVHCVADIHHEDDYCHHSGSKHQPGTQAVVDFDLKAAHGNIDHILMPISAPSPIRLLFNIGVWIFLI